MNKQITNLYKEAVTHASSELSVWQSRWTPDSPRFDYEKLLYTKFAELIITDCKHTVIQAHRGHINPALVVESLNKHFGIN